MEEKGLEGASVAHRIIGLFVIIIEPYGRKPQSLPEVDG